MKKSVLVAMFVSALMLVLGACTALPARAPAFPIGKVMLENDHSRSLQFNKDGTFAALASDMRLAGGTYTVQGDTYTETSNDQSCPSPRHYKFTIAGNKLVFHPVEDPKTDPCDGRRSDFAETATWLLSQ